MMSPEFKLSWELLRRLKYIMESTGRTINDRGVLRGRVGEPLDTIPNQENSGLNVSKGLVCEPDPPQVH